MLSVREIIVLTYFLLIFFIIYSIYQYLNYFIKRLQKRG